MIHRHPVPGNKAGAKTFDNPCGNVISPVELFLVDDHFDAMGDIAGLEKLLGVSNSHVKKR